MQTDLHCRLANRLGYCNRELRKQDCVRPLDGLSDQQVTTNQHPMVGGSMQVGDLVYGLHWMDFTPALVIAIRSSGVAQLLMPDGRIIDQLCNTLEVLQIK